MKPYRYVVVLTGAGISAESGIKTFRDSNGLWENHAIEDVATPEGFAKNPALVHAFYNERRRQLFEVSANAGHLALVKLEKALSDQGCNFLLITQNVDDLHERAGSRQLLHMHGELRQVRCRHSGAIFSHLDDCSEASVCPCCNQQQALRPHIVWFGEMPLGMDEIEKSLSQCDLFIAIGTSGRVYPAAGFVQQAKAYGAHTVEINAEPSEVEGLFDESHYGPATAVLPTYVNRLIGQLPEF